MRSRNKHEAENFQERKERRLKAQRDNFERLTQLNLKLEQVRRKHRIKKLLEEDLIKKGASAASAQSYITSLDRKDLHRINKNTHLTERYEQSLQPRF